MTNYKYYKLIYLPLAYLLTNFIGIICLFVYLSSTLAKDTFAQDAISLSISPPIVEIMIMPGKGVNQMFSIINEGLDGYASLKIVPFTPSDESGNVEINDNFSLENSTIYANWFSLIKPQVKFKDKFFIKSGDKQNVLLNITPPADTQEKDYYFTFLYETNNQGTTAKIGANLLISISKDGKPYKKAQIVEFSAPKIIDSLQKLSYTLKVENTGQFFFKPTGKITVNPLFGKKEVLKIAPVNIISSSTRTVPCILEEELVECTYDKRVLLGFYRAEASFSTDDEGKKYTAETTTVAFPFTLIFASTSLFLVYSLIKKITKK